MSDALTGSVPDELLPGQLPVAATAGGDLADGTVSHIIRAGFWSVLGHLSAASAAFAVSIVVARSLGPSPFGRYSFYLWVLRLLPVVLAVGVPAALTKLAAERIGRGDEQAAAGVAAVGLRAHLVILPLPCVLCAIAVSQATEDAAFGVLIGVGIAVGVLGLDFGALLPPLRRFRRLGELTVFVSATQLLAAVGCAAIGTGWQAFIGVQVVATALGAAGSALVSRDVLARARRTSVAPSERREVVRYARVMALALTVDAVLWGRPELFFLDRYGTDAEVGFYGAAVRLSSLAAVLPIVAAQALLPEFARLRGAGDDATLRLAYPRVCRLLALVAAPLALGGLAVAGPLVVAVYGEEFRGATTAAAILLVGSLVNAISAPATAAVLTGPRPKLIAEAGVVTVVINLALAAVLIPRYGVVAAAAVNTGVQFACILFGSAYAWMRLGFRYPVAATARTIGVAGLAALVAWKIGERLEPWPAVLVGGLVAVAGYVGLLVATRTTTASELLALVRPGRQAAER